VSTLFPCRFEWCELSQQQHCDHNCSTKSIFSPISAVGLTLNGVSYPNHGIVTITEIGTGSAALHCTTTLPGCCFAGNGGGWFFPNGNVVIRDLNLPYYRTRTSTPTGTLLLHRNPEATTTGIFRCDIPVTGGVLVGTQSLYVGVYTSTTGESCTLSECLVICKEYLALQTRTVHLRGKWGRGGRGSRGEGKEGGGYIMY